MAVLGTKLHRPAPRRDLVERPRLTDRLTSRMGTDDRPRLVLVAAPAGFGKTTLLSQWLAAATGAGTTVAWLSLDEGDNDPRRFLEHLVAALQAGGDFSEAAHVVASAAQLVPEAVLTSVVNELDLQQDGAILALDDFHVVESPDVQRAVAFLLEHLPPHTTLVVATRADPPLPLPRLRASGDLVELRAADLRFTHDEAGTFLGEVMGLHLGDAQLSALDARTEGWPAGLQLAGLSLQDVDDAAAFVDAFTGSHRFVLDYLVEEVLRHQDEHTRQFLLDTSILREITAPLCDALTDRTDGDAMLESLDRANLFLVPLDDERRWYRYHHLFAEALRARLIAQAPGRVPTLHRAASRWYAACGRVEDAVRHALAGDDPGRAARLVEEALPDLRRDRRDGVLRAWLTALPDEVVRPSAVLATFRAWTRLVDGDLDGVETWLQAAESALASNPPTPGPDASVATREELRTLPSTIGIYRAAVAQARGDTAGSEQHARRALDLTSADDHMARGGALGFLGLGAWARGRLAEAVDTFSEAVQELGAAGDVADELGSTVVLGTMWMARGRPDEASRLYRRALATAERHPGAALATLGDLNVVLADVLIEQGELDRASEHLDRARALGESSSLLENRHRWYVASAHLHRVYGDLATAADLLVRAEQLYLPGFFPDVRPVAAIRARVAIAQGHLADAWEWARAAQVAQVEHPDHLDEYDQLTFARLLLAQYHADHDVTHLDEALRRLDRLVPDASGGGRGGSLVEIRVVQALVHDARGDRAAALASLVPALHDGVPAGYVRLFLDEGTPMDSLLGAAERLPAAGDHAHRLRRAAYRAAPAAPEPVAEGLSDRELEVLRLLATSLSGPDIARRLFVSVNTLRTHTKHIFTKLDVNTRRAAVEQAQARGLL